MRLFGLISFSGNTIARIYPAAGRDRKGFLNVLSPDVVSKVVCLVDVDSKKIESIKWYNNPALLGGRRIRILHFSVLVGGGDKDGNGQEIVPPLGARQTQKAGKEKHERRRKHSIPLTLGSFGGCPWLFAWQCFGPTERSRAMSHLSVESRVRIYGT